MSLTMSEIYHDYFLARRCAAPEHNRSHLPACLEPLLPQKKDAAILDIGCGEGALLRALRDRGYQNLYGTDISEQSVQICREDGFRVEQSGDLADYAAKIGRRFDFITLTHVIEHIPKAEVISFLRVIRNLLLSSSGQLFVATPNAQAPTGTYWAYEDFTHEVLFTSGSLYFVLFQAGFRDIQFVDQEGLSGCASWKRPFLRLRHAAVRWLYRFWLKAAHCNLHGPSPVILTWEIKALAR